MKILRSIILLYKFNNKSSIKETYPIKYKQSKMPKTYTNKCTWLTRRKFTNCNKNCVGEYCAIHNFKFKKGGRVYPCTGCGIGVSNVYKLCMKCGYVSVYKKDMYQKRKHEKQLALDEEYRLLLERTKLELNFNKIENPDIHDSTLS